MGEQEGVRRKPAPDTVLRVMKEWGCKPSEVLYVGDSDVDVETARNAGVDGAAVCWGFRTEDELRAAGATNLFHTPKQLVITFWASHLKNAKKRRKRMISLASAAISNVADAIFDLL